MTGYIILYVERRKSYMLFATAVSADVLLTVCIGDVKRQQYICGHVLYARKVLSLLAD
jgi:hypothetical protein